MTRSTRRFARRPLLSMIGVASMFVAALVMPMSSADPVGATTGDDLVAESASLTKAASAYAPIRPVRILDTRDDPGISRVYRRSAFSIDPVTDTGVASRAGVDPDDITAVIVNTTMVRAGGNGFGTIWPTGTPRLSTSTNNTEFEGHTIPNLAIAPLGLDDKISVFASTDADVILDVLGVFVRSGATSGGRFESLGPVRAFDSRDGDPSIGAGETIEIDLTGAGVPSDASGVVVNVTSVRTLGRGYYRVWSAGDPEPEHSSLNPLSRDYNAGNQVITGVDDGRIKVFADTGGGLTVDVTGYFTGPGDEVSTEGLYVPFTPGRILDTRETAGPLARTSGRKLNADDEFFLQVAGRLDIPGEGAKAVSTNLTAIRPGARGFVKAYPAGTDEPPTSSLNFTDPGQIVPNHAITTLGAGTGEIVLKPSQETHVALDATGYFLAAGAVVPAPTGETERKVQPGGFVPDPLPGSPTTNGPYDFLFDRGAFFRTGRRPDPTIRAAWDNCQPIRYALNVDIATDDAQIDVLIDSIEEMEAVTGIDFQFGGVTSAGTNVDSPILLPESNDAPFRFLPPDDDGRGPVDLVIGFSEPRTTPDLDGSVIGIGGSLRTGQRPSGFAEQVRGFAIIDLPDLVQGGTTSDRTLFNIKATTTHELGHMMGLGHVDESRDGRGLNPDVSDEEVREQLMYPALNPSNEPDLDGGDRRGLFELYGDRPCAGSGQLGGDGEARDDVDLSGATLVRVLDER